MQARINDFVERLEKYKKVKGYKSLIRVVIELCDDALTFKRNFLGKIRGEFYEKIYLNFYIYYLFFALLVLCLFCYAESDASETTKEPYSETEVIARRILDGNGQGRLKNPDSFKVKNVSYIELKLIYQKLP